MMTTLLLTTHWRADDAQLVLEFLDELKEMISVAYAGELEALYESLQPTRDNDQDKEPDLFTNEIPF